MWIAAFLIGLFAGIISGMVSVGGSIIVTSMLILVSAVYTLELNMKQIVTTTAFYTLFTTISAAVYFWFNKLIDKRIVLFFGIPALAASLISSLWANSFSDTLLQGIFAFFTVLAAVAIIVPDRKSKQDGKGRFPYALSILLSVLVGTVGGMIGVAAGTGMVVGGLLCMGTILGKLSGEYIRADVIIPLGLSGILGALIGGKLTGIIKERWLNLLMCLIMAAIAVQTMSVFLADSLMVTIPVVVITAVGMSAVFLFFIFHSARLGEKGEKG